MAIDNGRAVLYVYTVINPHVILHAAAACNRNPHVNYMIPHVIVAACNQLHAECACKFLFPHVIRKTCQ